MKGAKKTGIAYLWNIMDRESRFIVASKRSENRDINGAIQAFNEAIKNSHNQEPQTVYTDALRTCREGVKQVLEVETDHVTTCDITNHMPITTGLKGSTEL